MRSAHEAVLVGAPRAEAWRRDEEQGRGAAGRRAPASLSGLRRQQRRDRPRIRDGRADFPPIDPGGPRKWADAVDAKLARQRDPRRGAPDADRAVAEWRDRVGDDAVEGGVGL